MGNLWKGPLKKIGEAKWEIPRNYKSCMRVPGVIYATDELIESIKQDQAPEQVANVACMPGIVKYSLAMPDIHWGYGFPIGGVAAFDVNEGVISPGGVGYDINCGVRIIRSDIKLEDLKPRLERVIQAIYENVPAGVGVGGKIKVSNRDLDAVMVKGARWVVEQGYGFEEDLQRIEEGGEMKGADPSKVSSRARERGRPQLGSLGAGNHFLEVQVVEEIYDEKVAEVFGLRKGYVTFMIHTGSRGFGHQVCDDYVKTLGHAMKRYGIKVQDRQLACVPFKSREGQSYFAAMVSAANYAWANRQFITHWVRESVAKVFGKSARSLGLHLVYDVAHNIAKVEEHIVDGKKRKLVVHRKGATRAFAAGRPEVPEIYRRVGQPVLIPGDMGTASYILVGTERAMMETFGSTCHGAGRVLSRAQAKRKLWDRPLERELRDQGILVKAHSRRVLVEEAPEAYKDVNIVVNTVHTAGISRKVAKLRPLAVVKG